MKELDIDLTKKKKTFTPHETLRQGTTFVAVEGDDAVLKIDVQITKVFRFEEDNGQPVLHPQTHMQTYHFEHHITGTMIPKEEYTAIKKSTLNLG